jgi:hypothetical protein
VTLPTEGLGTGVYQLLLEGRSSVGEAVRSSLRLMVVR